MPQNKFRECHNRPDVELNLPDGWRLRVVEVTSGDSGKVYWVQYIYRVHVDPDTEGTEIMLCDCPQGKFQQPLTVLGLKAFWCKHAQAVATFFEKEQK